MPGSRLTNNHDVEIEPFAYTFAVPLVGQVCKTDVSSEFPAHNVHVVGHGGRGLRVLCCDRLCCWRVTAVSHGEGLIHGVAVGRCWGRWGRTRRRGGRCAVGFCIRVLAPPVRMDTSVAVERGNVKRRQSWIETAARRSVHSLCA